MVPLNFHPITEFDPSVHTIDNVAKKWLQRASKSVQHLVPIKSPADGNCLSHSISYLMPGSSLTAIELRGLLT